jgi:hypothetical protein
MMSAPAGLPGLPFKTEAKSVQSMCQRFDSSPTAIKIQTLSGIFFAPKTFVARTFNLQGSLVMKCEVCSNEYDKKVSPKGIGSGIRMIQYFLNRGGKGLSAGRKREVEKAKRILQAKLHQQK